jgi:hypothetical protein
MENIIVKILEGIGYLIGRLIRFIFDLIIYSNPIQFVEN